MKIIRVKLKSDGPLLMHALPQGPEEKIRDTGKEFDPKEEAEKGLYRDEKGKIYFPSRWIKGCLEKRSQRSEKRKSGFEIKSDSGSFNLSGNDLSDKTFRLQN